MAGHSKWANIKYRKERSDVKKGKIFSRIAKEVITAVKLSGPDPKSNPRLRLAIQKAKLANMPNDNIERNIKKASSSDQADFEEVMYEIYGHGGVGIIVQAMTDNKNRTASDMRIAINKKGGVIASPGSVAFNFERKGVLQIPKESVDEELLFQAVIDAGGEDLEVADELFMITTDPSLLYAVKESLEAQKMQVVEEAIAMIPKTQIACDEETRSANLALIGWLEDLEDVDAVFHNMEM